MEKLKVEIKEQFASDEMESVTIEWCIAQEEIDSEQVKELREIMSWNNKQIKMIRNRRETIMKTAQIQADKYTDTISELLEANVDVMNSIKELEENK